MDREDLEWLESVQNQAYHLYATGKMQDDDYMQLYAVIDQILFNNKVNAVNN